ncbi:low-density lipoprotein receptor-related protein 4-like [Ylistrum balloti]|uniref:low-density lipoprotein receptor-related protein 4-like n=1 Tax=Ylistrum balloti TaxID=509963 RepID=UPI002905C5DC|nr:low-density lipoprotein receptor-related protein 4-like [Ylistrum balloti]
MRRYLYDVPKGASVIYVSVDEGLLTHGGIFTYTDDGNSFTENSPHNFTRVELSDIQITSMDVNVADGSIYFFDLTSRCIYRLHSEKVETVHSGISSSYYTSIAYDWVSRNMYWTDGFFNWIAVQPVNTMDRSMYRVLIQNDIEKPSALAVDSKAGYMFWFDISTSGYRIERAMLDGTSRIPIIVKNLIRVWDIEIDTSERRLYWTEVGRNAIESSLYDGTDRRIIYKELGIQFRSIAVDTDHVCTTVHETPLWTCIVKSTGAISLIRKSEFLFTQPVAIAISKAELRPSLTNGCLTLGCEHFCVNLQSIGKCLCKEGYTLNTDGIHCTENHPLYHKAIVVSSTTKICMLSFRTATNHSDPLRCVSNLVQGGQFLTVDASNKLIFYVDTTSNFIKEYNLITDKIRQITPAETVSGIAFDWTDGNLYWLESARGKVKYVTIARTAARDLVDTDSPPSHLTMDPLTRTLFWVEGTSGFEMSIVAMPIVTKEKSVILTQPLPAYIKDIFFDVSSDRLYFIQSDRLSNVARNGSDIEHLYKGLQSVEKMIVYKRYAFWSTSTSAVLFSTALQQLSPQRTYLTSGLGKITGLAVYDEAIQRPTRGPCFHFNGGCEQICLTGISGSAVCDCSYGLTLQSDGKSCGSVPQTTNFLLLTDVSHNRLVQISTIDAQITVLDINTVGRALDALYDPISSFVFWSNVGEDSIMTSALNGTNSGTVHTTAGDGKYPTALAMDHSNGNLYYSVSSDASQGSIGVLKPSQGLFRTLVGGLGYVNGIVLYPSKGLMFYTNADDNNTFSSIIRVSMDGSSPNVIADLEPDDFITNIAIDYTTDRLYWSSMGDGIQSSSLSGSKREELTTYTSRIRSIAIAGGFLYFTSDRRDKVIKMNLQTGEEVRFMTDKAELGLLHNIFVFPGQVQPVNSVCAVNNGGCSTFCLPIALTSTSNCACQDGTYLKPDDPFTCQGVTRCPSGVTNGKLNDACTRNAAEVCTLQCNSGYANSLVSNNIRCGQNGQWDANLGLACQHDVPSTDTPTQQLTVTYISAGLAALVIIVIAVVAIVCIVSRRRQSSPRPSPRSEPNVYYSHQQNPQQNPCIIASGMYQEEGLFPAKPGTGFPADIPTPPYSVRPDPVYDTIAPAPPYEEPNISHHPSLRSQTSVVSVQSENSDYLTLIRQGNNI